MTKEEIRRLLMHLEVDLEALQGIPKREIVGGPDSPLDYDDARYLQDLLDQTSKLVGPPGW